MMVNRLNDFSHNSDDIHKRLKERWETEPDFVSLVRGNYHLVIWRNLDLGQLNGYVGIKRSHPFFGKDMHSDLVSDLRVHWGVTFAGKAIHEGFKKKLWYIGFDTAHAFDYVPGLEIIRREMEESQDPFLQELNKMIANMQKVVPIPMGKNLYKDIDFVSSEVVSLHDQLVVATQNKKPQVRRSHKKQYRELHKIKIKMQKRNSYSL